MTEPSHHDFVRDGDTLHYLRWGEPGPDTRAALLMHGLGFVAAIWAPLAEALVAAGYVVYALDRRGHGRSRHASTADSRFEVFAADLVALSDALELRGALAVVHSSGATDTLLAAGLRPGTFAGILALEPTVRDPRQPPQSDPTLSGLCQMLLERTRRRREGYATRAEALEALQARSPLKGWRPELLALQVEEGFWIDEQAEGAAKRCLPSPVEAQMLVAIFQTMENRYPGDEFGQLLKVDCPVLVLSTDGSDPIYLAMAKIAATVIPNARHERCSGVTHFWGQEQPETFIARALEFAQEIFPS